MAKGGRMSLDINAEEFRKRLQVVARKVERGTKKATQAALDEILEESLSEVPYESFTLFDSGFTEVRGYKKDFTGIVGYGGNGDPVNPRTGQRASKYMVAVHEDLQAVHRGGKAKFLEDPVKRYQAKFARRTAQRIRQETGM
jgi:hypothetical protein